MIREIQAKRLLSNVKQPDTWFGLKYNLNLYRGCQHQCIYCDSRSECYQIENFADILVKANAIELLTDELARKRIKGTIGTGSMNDPYMPIEKKINLTGRALAVISRFRFPVHVLTKSDLVLRDVEMLQRISKVFAAVSFSVSVAEDKLAGVVEPGASPVTARLRALSELSKRGIQSGVILMPLLPFIGDTEQNVIEIVRKAHEAGAQYIIPSFAVTMRDRQRDYFYEKLDTCFPGVREKYETAFGRQYQCAAANARHLEQIFHQKCEEYKIPTRMKTFEADCPEQPELF